MKRIVSGVLLLMIVGFIAVGDGFVFYKSIASPGHFFTTDHLGAVYLLNNDEIRKYSSDGELLYTFSSKTYGTIFSADPTDPLKVLLYYRDLQKVIRLDHQLAIQGNAIDLYQFDVSDPTLVCGSYDNGFWIWDQGRCEMIRINQHLQEDQRSRKLTETNPVFSFMQERNFNLVATDTASGIYIFDRYGALSKIIPVKQVSKFQHSHDAILYQKGAQLIALNMTKLSEDTVFLPESNCEEARVVLKKLYVKQPDRVNIYNKLNN